MYGWGKPHYSKRVTIGQNSIIGANSLVVKDTTKCYSRREILHLQGSKTNKIKIIVLILNNLFTFQDVNTIYFENKHLFLK